MGRRSSRGDGSQRTDAALAPIMDLVPFGLVVATPDGSARQANRTWQAMSEQADGAWRDAGWFAVLPMEKRDQARRALVEDIGAGRTHDVDWVLRRSASGGTRVVRVEATPQRIDGEVTGMVVVATDVTTQREEVHDLVARSDRDPSTVLDDRTQGFEPVRDVLAVAAHEIKTPLTSIVGYAATLRATRHRMSEDAAEAAFDALERQTVRLATMVDQLLQLGRLGHPSHVAEVLVDLDTVIADALEIAPPAAPATVLVMVASDASGPLVWADPTALVRAVVNLLTNAYAHGGPHITVEVSIGDRCVDLVVEDDGDGVPDDLVPVLFEPFARGPRRPSRTAGTGLGLAITQAIAMSLGGSLEHEPVVPHGARFHLSLPLSS